MKRLYLQDQKQGGGEEQGTGKSRLEGREIKKKKRKNNNKKITFYPTKPTAASRGCGMELLAMPRAPCGGWAWAVPTVGAPGRTPTPQLSRLAPHKGTGLASRTDGETG